ncbi:UTP--glucose-1-phosphate uridylyltransferase [Loktanella atrilutea]|uniref:UTP--glucose-1-phosphate uridylyltransferase n=1 Tax=Loktanella atrilutea TaxID=366533 RepID=A0A1M4WYD5_LOKAT|nr:sugar phosphate nucleotidyltransferase [Loktanella atrilutea]SHE85972.1 UTP--glucose-1-phosphate uridylyltransferase [Loktanella atrilutea]
MPVLDTVVFPVAGRGTRLLPVTKSVPKELLPVYDKPILQFAVEEAVAAGAQRLVFITHASKRAINEYLQPDTALMDVLRTDGKAKLVRALEDITLGQNVEVLFVDQEQPLGLGHAVLMAAEHVRGDAFGVILPDDVILGRPCLPEMAEAYEAGHMIAAMDVPEQDVSKYGIFRPLGDGAVGRIVRASELVEKPAPDVAPSRLAAVGRYILDARIFDALRALEPGAGGEYQLTDAIAADAGDLSLTGFRFSGARHDCGSHEGLLGAANARAAELACVLAAE